MITGVVGLGLIGGSMARAYKLSGHTVLGADSDNTILDFTIMSGAVDEKLTKDNLKDCDLLLIASYPVGAEEYLSENAPCIAKHTIVIDCLGTKRKICKLGFELAEKYGFTYVGGHPMAGTQFSGFKNSRADLFVGAPMVIVPPRFDDIEFLDHIKKILEPAGFGYLSVTTAEEHDRMIAFTSQMAHIVSNAYIKSPTAGSHKGFSAGSYKDLTRVARLNPRMWTELFLENGDFVLNEIDCMIASLREYREAVAAGDAEGLEKLLDEGSRRKMEIDG